MKIVVNELIEYSYDLDLNFSRRAVKTIWELGILYRQDSDIVFSALISVL